MCIFLSLFAFLFRVTNGGKTTLTNKLIKTLPSCCVVHQDDFFKVSFSEWIMRVLFVLLFPFYEHCMSIACKQSTTVLYLYCNE